MPYPDAPPSLPDPAARPNILAPLKTHLDELFGPYRENIQWLKDKVGTGTTIAQDRIAGLAASLAAKADLTSGLVPNAQLGTGSATAATVLLGNRTWGAPPGGGGGTNTAVYWIDVTSFAGTDKTGDTPSDVGFKAAVDLVRTAHAPTEVGTNPTGAAILVPPGEYRLNNTWDMTNVQGGLRVQGFGVNTVGGGNMSGATSVYYTGVGPVGVDCSSSNGVVIEGMQIAFTNPAFCGALVKFGLYSRTVTGASATAGEYVIYTNTALASDKYRMVSSTNPSFGPWTIQSVVPGVSWTVGIAFPTTTTSMEVLVRSPECAYCFVRNCRLTGIGTRGGTNGTGGTSAKWGEISRLLTFNGCIDSGTYSTGFSYAGRAIDGTCVGDPTWSGYANHVTVIDCTFNHMTQAHIWNAAQSWTIMANNFEGDGSDIHSPAYQDDVPNPPFAPTGNNSTGVLFAGNWCGDSEGPYWINAQAGRGWTVTGNYLSRFWDSAFMGDGSPTPMLGPTIKMKRCEGWSITGNWFRSCAPPFDLDSQNAPWNGTFIESCDGIEFSGNIVGIPQSNGRTGYPPTNYTGLANIDMRANNWGTGCPINEIPGRGVYTTDAEAKQINYARLP